MDARRATWSHWLSAPARTSAASTRPITSPVAERVLPGADRRLHAGVDQTLQLLLAHFPRILLVAGGRHGARPSGVLSRRTQLPHAVRQGPDFPVPLRRIGKTPEAHRITFPAPWRPRLRGSIAPSSKDPSARPSGSWRG